MRNFPLDSKLKLEGCGQPSTHPVILKVLNAKATERTQYVLPLNLSHLVTGNVLYVNVLLKVKFYLFRNCFFYNELSPLTNDIGKFLTAFFFQYFFHEWVQLLFFLLDCPIGTITT